MATTGIVIPLHDIRTAVRTLCRGLLLHERITADQWDSAVTTLARAIPQLGGPTRRHLQDTLAASDLDAPPQALPEALEALAGALNVPTGPEIADQLPLFPRDH